MTYYRQCARECFGPWWPAVAVFVAVWLGVWTAAAVWIVQTIRG